jgi:hypothetical protein
MYWQGVRQAVFAFVRYRCREAGIDLFYKHGLKIKTMKKAYVARGSVPMQINTFYGGPEYQLSLRVLQTIQKFYDEYGSTDVYTSFRIYIKDASIEYSIYVACK